MKVERVQSTDSDAIILGLYGVFAIYHGLNRGRIYRPRHEGLIWHVLSGVLEVILYYGNFQCSIVAVISCWIHSYTSLVLVRDLPNGYPPHTRPAYQAGSIMRSVLVVRAYFSQNPVHYHDSMMPLHGFVYTRALIFLLGTMGPTRSFTTNLNSQFVYAESVFGAALISIGHCHGSWPVPVYLLLVHFLGKLSLWVEEIHESSKKNNLVEPTSLTILRQAGFQMCEPASELTKVPSIGHLRMDFLGDWWTKK